MAWALVMASFPADSKRPRSYDQTLKLSSSASLDNFTLTVDSVAKVTTVTQSHHISVVLMKPSKRSHSAFLSQAITDLCLEVNGPRLYNGWTCSLCCEGLSMISIVIQMCCTSRAGSIGLIQRRAAPFSTL